MDSILIQVRDVTKAYDRGVRALDQVNLDICRGEWVSVMGPSGSGKTTLLNLLGCLDKPTVGTIRINASDLTSLTQKQLTRFRRENIGLIFQQFHLISYLTALENVMLAQYYHSMTDKREAESALKQVGLGDRLTHYPSQLSGGEQQRVCIARALINQPKLILADEPTGNLDEENEEMVLQIFRQLYAAGHTLVVVTHDMWVGKMGTQIVRLEHGRVVSSI